MHDTPLLKGPHMTAMSMTRRSALLGGASLTLAAGVTHTLPAFAQNAPYPLLSQGRLTQRDPATYYAERLSGGPGKDGIPAIDAPHFWTPDEADGYLDGGDIVFGLVENGIARAYPQRILVWHEIVNDTVGGTGLAVTYCPLTGTAITFERANTEFGVSGRLVNSNLIMFDRDTDTWFPQILAVGISGPHQGGALVERPIMWTTWDRWRATHPDTEVLSTQTGFARNYNRDPYGAYNPRRGYYEPDSDRMFPVMNEDGRLPLKSVVLGARTADASVAVRKDALREAGRLELKSGGTVFTAIHDTALDTGYIFAGRTQAQASTDGTGPNGVTWSGGDGLTPVNAFEAMWFAWAAFYPETFLHG